jgi:hypothetical protein
MHNPDEEYLARSALNDDEVMALQSYESTLKKTTWSMTLDRKL